MRRARGRIGASAPPRRVVLARMESLCAPDPHERALATNDGAFTTNERAFTTNERAFTTNGRGVATDGRELAALIGKFASNVMDF